MYEYESDLNHAHETVLITKKNKMISALYRNLQKPKPCSLLNKNSASKTALCSCWERHLIVHPYHHRPKENLAYLVGYWGGVGTFEN